MTPEREVFPEVLAPGDPCAGDEAIFEPGSHENYVRFGRGPLDGREYARAEVEFFALKQAILQGLAPFEAILPLVERLGVDHPIQHDKRPLLDAYAFLPDEVLADAVEDLLADVAMVTERITGDPLQRATVGILAALAYVPYMDNGRRPVDAWGDEEDRERHYVIASVAIDRAPPTVWVDGRSMFEFPERFVPPAGPATTCVARAYRVGEEWAFSGVVELPCAPAFGPLFRRMQLEHWDLRRAERRSTWEDVLRLRPAVLYRAAMEGARRITGR